MFINFSTLVLSLKRWPIYSCTLSLLDTIEYPDPDLGRPGNWRSMGRPESWRYMELPLAPVGYI